MTLYSSIYPKELTQRPVIIAICGKSATGKDTLLTSLSNSLKFLKVPTNIIVSDTTRPPRLNEVNGIDYNFITDTEFYNKIYSKQYIEYSCFNSWLYGVDYHAIKENFINIGVFNIDGVINLNKYADKFEIVCVYLKCNIKERLERSIHREKKFKLEYIRRILADYKNFKNIDKIINKIPDNFIYDSSQVSISTMTNNIIRRLKMKNFLPSHNKLL